jgi:TolA-binding protein
MEPLQVTGDIALEKLNDEELFTRGSAAFAAADYAEAERYFTRLIDFFPDSPHHRAALFNDGLAEEKLKHWEDADRRFAELSDAHHGTGDALDATFRLAETHYQLGRFQPAINLLSVLEAREDLSLNQRLEAQVQHGICELEAGQSDDAENTLRQVVNRYQENKDRESLDDYFPAQAQFFLGEIYRLHYEAVQLDPEKGTDDLAHDLNYKAELLLSAQGHYLRSIRIGNGYWATAAGARIGELYQNMYESMVAAPAPKELAGEEAQYYRNELRKRIRVLLSKAVNAYERTLETAERIGSSGVFIDQTRESLAKIRQLLLAEAPDDSSSDADPAPATPPEESPQPEPRSARHAPAVRGTVGQR